MLHHGLYDAYKGHQQSALCWKLLPWPRRHNSKASITVPCSVVFISWSVLQQQWPPPSKGPWQGKQIWAALGTSPSFGFNQGAVEFWCWQLHGHLPKENQCSKHGGFLHCQSWQPLENAVQVDGDKGGGCNCACFFHIMMPFYLTSANRAIDGSSLLNYFVLLMAKKYMDQISRKLSGTTIVLLHAQPASEVLSCSKQWLSCYNCKEIRKQMGWRCCCYHHHVKVRMRLLLMLSSLWKSVVMLIMMIIQTNKLSSYDMFWQPYDTCKWNSFISGLAFFWGKTIHWKEWG